MGSRVDEARRAVIVDGAEWPFRLDLRRGVAILQTPHGERRVRPQRWIEKCRMAQFAGWGEAFLCEQLWQMCLRPADPPVDESERSAGLELAVWLSAGGCIGESLPLDRALLGRVALASCHALGVSPAALDDRPAYEVESLWRSTLSGGEASRRANVGHGEEFTHKIVVVPDAPHDVPAPSTEATSAFTGAVPLRDADPPAPSTPPTKSNAERSAAHSGDKAPGQRTQFSHFRVVMGKAPAPQPPSARNLAPSRDGAAIARESRSGQPQPADSPHSEVNPQIPITREPATVEDLAAPPSDFAVTRDAATTPNFPTMQDRRDAHDFSFLSANEEFAISEFPTAPWRTSAAPSAGATPASNVVPPEFAPATPPPAVAPSFQDFAAEFADRLAAAAAELGILEDR